MRRLRVFNVGHQPGNRLWASGRQRVVMDCLRRHMQDDDYDYIQRSHNDQNTVVIERTDSHVLLVMKKNDNGEWVTIDAP